MLHGALIKLLMSLAFTLCGRKMCLWILAESVCLSASRATEPENWNEKCNKKKSKKSDKMNWTCTYVDMYVSTYECHTDAQTHIHNNRLDSALGIWWTVSQLSYTRSCLLRQLWYLAQLPVAERKHKTAEQVGRLPGNSFWNLTKLTLELCVRVRVYECVFSRVKNRRN